MEKTIYIQYACGCMDTKRINLNDDEYYIQEEALKKECHLCENAITDDGWGE